MSALWPHNTPNQPRKKRPRPSDRQITSTQQIHRIGGHTYECDDDRCLLCDTGLGVGPAILGGVQAHDAQILQEHAVRVQGDVRVVVVHRHVHFGPLEAARAARQRLGPGQLDVWQGAGILQDFAGRGALEHATIAMCVVGEQAADDAQQQYAADEVRTARRSRRRSGLLNCLLL